MDDCKVDENCMTDAFDSWIRGRQDSIGSICLRVRDSCDSFLSLEANGWLLQLVIPSRFRLAVWESVESDEVFLVTSLESTFDEVFANTLNELNEKLERVRIKPTALNEVLDHLLLALQKFEARKSQDQTLVTLSPGKAPQRNRSAQGIKNDGISDSENTDIDNCGKSNSLDHCGSHIQFWSKGFLFMLAEDANLKCAAARKKANWGNLQSYNEDSPPFAGILQWCSVKPDSGSLTIHSQIELAGIVYNDSAVFALGISLNSPVKLLLKFGQYSPLKGHLKLQSVLVSQEMTSTSQSGYELYGAAHKLYKVDQMHLYGIEVLMPDLVQTYFDFFETKTVSRFGKNLNNSDMFEELEQCTAMDNPFIGFLCFIGARFRALPNWCVVCWNSIPYSVWRLRTCDNDFCLFRFEELGLGAPVLQEVQNSPELFDFELSLAMVASNSIRDVFEPFPAFLLIREEIRGRSGWFSDSERVELHPSARTQIESTAQALTARAQVKWQAQSLRKKRLIGRAHSGNKNMRLLEDVLCSYPPIEKMKLCADEVALKMLLSKFWPQKPKADGQNYIGKRPEEPDSYSVWKKKPWLPYDILRFVLSTNRLSFHLLQGDIELQFDNSVYQFAILHDSPEREAYFERRRREQGGSFFAFHGSAADNWYSILRNGLRCLSETPYMSYGASFGSGIYLASQMSTSLCYCACSGRGYQFGLLKEGFSVLSICEVVSGSASTNIESSGIIVVPPEHEKDVAIRYILVFKGIIPHGSHKISGTVMSNKTDLLQHYNNLRLLYLSKQRDEQSARMESRCKVFLTRH